MDLNEELPVLKICLWDHLKLIEDEMIGELTLPLEKYKNRGLVEEWFEVFSPSSKEIVTGDILVTISDQGKNFVVKAIKGRNLASKDPNGYSDPFLRIAVGKNEKKTNWISKTLFPCWEEEHSIARDPKATELVITCYDRDIIGSDEFVLLVKFV